MIKYRNANSDDMQAIAQTHIVCFKNYFLTELDGGKGNVLTKFYRSYYNNDVLFIVAEDGDKIVGFVMGYIPPDKARKQFEKENFWLLSVRMMCLLCMFNKKAWSRVFSRIKNIFVKKKNSNDLEELKNLKRSGLLSICVLPEYRGSGVAIELINAYENLSIEKGADYYTLSALKNNDRGNAFYKKLGFKKKGEDKEEYYYYKMLKSTKV